MSDESTSFEGVLNPLPDIDFDVRDPNGWYQYVADSLVLTGLSRRSGEAYAREIRILVRRFGRPPFMLTEGDVRTFILERHKRLNGSSQRILYRGLRFVLNDLLKYDWELLKAVRAKRGKMGTGFLWHAGHHRRRQHYAGEHARGPTAGG